jgi:hypothetical protein
MFFGLVTIFLSAVNEYQGLSGMKNHKDCILKICVLQIRIHVSAFPLLMSMYIVLL